jgi:4-amino-4-deoxy-L-arabinose transferase-like glycosyltransferase
VISLALYRTGRLLMDRSSALLAVLWYNLSIGLALSLLATPDVPSTLFWMLAAWAVAEFIASRNANWWLAVGLFAGLGVLGKYTNLILGAGIVVFILSSRERWAWLKLWQLWAGGIIAALVVAPNLIWNSQNSWISFTFQGGRIVNDPRITDLAANYLEMLGAQALFLGPLVVLFFLVGVILFVFRSKQWPQLAWPVLSGLPALVYFAIHASRARVEANWLLPLWPMATLAAAFVVVAGLRSNAGLRLLRSLTVYAQTLLGLSLIVLLAWIVVARPEGLKHLDRTYHMHGWTETAQALDALADQQGATWVAMPAHYGLVGEFATYTHFIGSERPVISVGERQRYRFEPLDPAALTFPTVLVDPHNNRAGFEAMFGAVEPLGTIERSYKGEVLASYPVYEVGEPTKAFYDAMR